MTPLEQFNKEAIKWGMGGLARIFVKSYIATHFISKQALREAVERLREKMKREYLISSEDNATSEYLTYNRALDDLFKEVSLIQAPKEPEPKDDTKNSNRKMGSKVWSNFPRGRKIPHGPRTSYLRHP